MNPFQLTTSIIVVVVLGVFSLKVRIVNITGFIAAEIVGSIILILGNAEWFIVLLAFYFTAGLFTKYKYEYKKRIGAAEEKGGARGWKNVVANGLVASLLAMGYGLVASNIFSAGLLGAISTSAADTLATEIGLLYPRQPRLITNLNKNVEPGTSGGVSPLGEIANLFGGTLIGLVAWIVGFSGFTLQKILTITIISGFLGSTFDSLLGAWIQATFRCPVCNKITEKTTHCEKTCKLIKGNKIFDNNVVNTISTIFGATIATMIFLTI
ncbi:MAG: hypothetical protein QG670_2679 [Thermoproteota archaeon]|nr:hypothetical protein [Thermoproteota archaeon]